MKRKELIKIKYEIDKSIDFTVNINKFNKKSITYRGMDILVDKVSLKKDEAFVKDLRIEITGNWESRDNTLVYVIKTVNVPRAKEVYLISQKSLENLAATFKYRYENDRIHMGKIKYIDGTNFTLINEKLRETKYKRQ